VGPQGAVGLLRRPEVGRVLRWQDRGPFELEGHDRPRLVSGGEFRDLHDELLHVAGEFAVAKRLHQGGDVLLDDPNLLLGPVPGHRERGVDAPARAAVGGHRHPDAMPLGADVTEAGRGCPRHLLRVEELPGGR